MYRELFLKLRQSVGLGILNRYIYYSAYVNGWVGRYPELLAYFDQKPALLRGFYELTSGVESGDSGAYDLSLLTSTQPTVPGCQRKTACRIHTNRPLNLGSGPEFWLQFANAIEFGQNNCNSFQYFRIQRCFD